MTTVAELISDLAAEQDDLDGVLGSLRAEQWRFSTPSPGWTIADQAGHLAYFDRSAALAITDGEAFKTQAAAMMRQASTSGMDVTLDEPRAMSAEALLEWWREGTADLITAAATLGETTRLRWYGPDMGAKSFLTARLMEAWAHGLDVCDSLGLDRKPTDRLRHIAQLGVITRRWSYLNRGREPDVTPVSVRLTAPSGGVWSWEDEGAKESISGSVEAFAQVVTQRRHVSETDLVVVGAAAAEWMDLAQAFAGGATTGPGAGTSA